MLGITPYILVDDDDNYNEYLNGGFVEISTARDEGDNGVVCWGYCSKVKVSMLNGHFGKVSLRISLKKKLWKA
jgi:hypothetical protein